MTTLTSDDSFYTHLPRLTRFGEIFEGKGFHPVPDDWWVACTDVVGSTKAIEAGHYKEVNVAAVQDLLAGTAEMVA